LSVEQEKAENSVPGGESPDAESRARAEEISRLFREHNRALLNFVLTKVPNAQEAREVAQEAYVRLLQLDQPVAIGYLRWYLFKIARRIACDHYRRHDMRARLDQRDGTEDLDLASPTENSVMAADELSRLMSALRELPRKCQRAFLLHRLRDLSTIEVAAKMGITDRMVRNYIRRALVYCRFRGEGLSKEEASRRAEA
jgi:RNA polymerase sigma factor (sigma-70 family)